VKQLAQTFLVIGGLLGFIISIPVSVFGWAMHKGFSGDLSSSDWLLLYGPAICLAALIIGRLWIRRDKRHEIRRGSLIEDGGAHGDAGGFGE
jgi:hypothetical protein